jgi:histidine decarboxylase
MIQVHRDLPVVVMANIGTTVRGAVDDLEKIKGILQDLRVTNAYIHADAALSGLILPFVAEPQPFGFDAGIDSISISGHKLIGAPLPCGVVVTRRAHVERVGRAVEYVGVHDTTLSGSRNGFAPLMLWYALETLGEDGLREKVDRMLDTAEYAVSRFNKSGIRAWRNRNSATVVFPKPQPGVFTKWQIAPEGRDVRIVTMPHVTREMVDELVQDCAG